MMNTKRNRGGRMNSGRPDKRQIYQDRPQRSRGPPVDKNTYIEGVYRNQRYTNVVFSLVGTIVQAQVKNGIVYEGILKTMSQKGDVVLEMAHMVEDNTGSSSPGFATPSRDRIMDKLVIRVADLITINAANVDLEYAVKDAFTDTGISKYNGELKEKEMRELQPWVSEGADEVGSLEGDRSNGWDVHDMFQTNAQMYNIKSTYDESLGQYTTKLNKENSEEYRRREEEAARLAAEIERSEQYKKRIALENGEGDDEEAAFSSVVRPSESPLSTGSGGPGKYIPPNKRNLGAEGMSKPGGRGYAHPHQQRAPPPQHHHQQQPPPVASRSISSHRQSPPVTQTSSSQSSVDTVSVNGEKPGRSSVPTSTAGPTIKTSSPVQESGGPTEVKHDHNPQQHPAASKSDSKKSMKGRDEQIKELKEFSSNFKLDDNKETKDKDKERPSGTESKDSANKEPTHEEKEKEKEPVKEKVSEAMATPEKPAKITEEKKAETESSQEKTVEAEQKPVEIPTIKSILNPLANEFTPSAHFQKQTTQQIPTPPRPHTQSPIIQQAPMMAQPVYPGPGQSYIMPPNTAMVPTAQPQQLPYNVRPKRAVVSVKPDYPPSAAVQAATGQPLLAQSSQSYMYIHAGMMPPQPTGYQMGQVMPMPAAQTPPRFMTPTSMQGMPPTTMPGAGLDQSTPSGGQGGQMYMAPHQQGPMPAHINPSHLHNPNHMNHLNMSTNTQQNTQMNPPPLSGAGQHHPAPSPVLTNHSQQPMNSGPHPPSSGTPQPPQGYPQATLQAPPLQPSPHNPTSPQNMQQMPYHYNTSHPLQMPSSAGGQFSLPQHSTGQSSVTYSMQSHQSPHMQPQIVMMPPQMSASGQLNHPHHIHGSHQFQGHPMAGPGSMQQQLMTQSGVQGLHTQNPGQGPHQHQMQHFLPQVHNAGGQPVQNYQPSQ